ncbi:hypothetical protein [Streptomyces sp. NPDC001978]|uniref:hypothetical protein n=1 Tax=Streptomyces sp. NPDC001978 TaxID=3364627 RepID=UPI0036B308D1
MAAGQRITADRLNGITPIFQSWTPSWTTSSGAATPSIGNGTYDCEYAQVGNLVVCRFEVVFGTTTNFGGGGASDNWRFSAPVTAAAITTYAGTAELTQTNSLRVYSRARLTTTTTFEFEVSSGQPDGNAVGNTGLTDSVTPWTWASGNAIRAFMSYEAA